MKADDSERRAKFRLVEVSGCSGRVSPGLALLIALLICGGVSYYFLRPNPLPVPGAGETDGATGPAALTDGGAQPGGASSSVPGAGAVAERTGTDSGVATSVDSISGTRRIFGSVTDTSGHALPGMALRWMPLQKNELRMYSHDPRVLEKDADLSGVPAGRLRDALSRSELTTSAGDGTYELRVPAVGEPGVVIVSGSGYEMQIRSADPDHPDAAAVVAEKPAEAAAATPDASTDLEIRFQLEAAGRISGKVTDVDTGDVVSGMAVVAGVVDPESPAMMSFVNEDAASSVTAADGTYLIAGLKPGEYRVLPRRGNSDYVAFSTRQATRVDLEAGLEVTEVDFQVSLGGRIFGRVLGPRERPIPGAKCSAMPTDLIAASMTGNIEVIRMLERQAVRTDIRGAYEIRAVPRGKSYRVIVEADGFAAGRSDVVEVAEDAVEVNLELAIGSSVLGRVVTEDGTPSPEVDVSVIPDIQKIMAGDFDSSLARLRTKTDVDGSFRLEHLSAGEYRLYAGEMKTPDIWGVDQKRGKVVEVDGVHDVTGVEIILPGADEGIIAGLVTDDEGTPIEGASIRVMKPADFVGTSATRLTTDVDGRFAASDLEGAVFRLGASKPGYSSADLSEVAIGSTDVRLVLNRHGRISGRVLTPPGLSLAPGGEVKAQKAGGQSFLESIQSMIPGQRAGEDREVRLNADGTFSVDAPAGMAEILVTVPSFAPATSQSIDVKPGEEYTGVDILVTSGAVVAGRVTLAHTGPVSGATVTVTPVTKEDRTDMMSELMPQLFSKNRNQATTDEDGAFEVPHLAPGKYKVMAARSDYAPSEAVTITLARDQVKEGVNLVLTRGGTISGVVLEVDTPKAGLMVQLMGGGPIKQATTAADGTFVFEGLRSGDYMVNFLDLAAMQKGKMAVKTRPTTVQDGQVTELEVVFGIGRRITGKVRGLPSAPIRMVTLRRPGGPAPESLDPTDVQASIAASQYQAGVGMIAPDGTFEVTDLEPGEYVLEIPRMPSNPADLEAYKAMDRTPYYRKEVTVGTEDVRLDIVVKK